MLASRGKPVTALKRLSIGALELDADVKKARGFMSVLETKETLLSFFPVSSLQPFTVRIGPETGVPEISDCSVVTATYATRNGRQGTIGVIGPTRMQYSRVLSVLASMGQHLSEFFGGEDDGSQ